MRELLFTVTRDGVLAAGFAHIADAEAFAAVQTGCVEVRSRGDGYVYYRMVDGRDVVS